MFKTFKPFKPNLAVVQNVEAVQPLRSVQIVEDESVSDVSMVPAVPGVQNVQIRSLIETGAVNRAHVLIDPTLRVFAPLRENNLFPNLDGFAGPVLGVQRHGSDRAIAAGQKGETT